MKSIVAALLALSVGCGSWTRADVARQVTFGVTMAADAVQTIEITADCDEINPVIGQCGENVPVIPYFIGTMMIHTMLAHLLRGSKRSAFQWVSIGVEAGTVVNNTLQGD
jgi:hypothetical protein